jgi:hypothetical protein
MKSILGFFGKAFETLRPQGTAALAAARREWHVAANDLRSLYSRSWSDRGHL